MDFHSKVVGLFLLLFPAALTAQNDSCIYRLQLVDFFGDGWDGASLDIVLGEDTTNITLIDSTIRFYEINAIQNERFQIFFNSGSFDEEISYILRNPQNEIVFNDGPNPQIGLVVDLLACPSCPAPTVIQTNTKTHSAEISWQASKKNTRYLVEYGIKGFERGTGTQLVTEDSLLTINQLSEFTTYDLYFSTICPEQDTSLTILSTSFTTRFMTDVGIEAILSPNSSCGLSNELQIELALKNFGTLPQTFIPFHFSVNGIEGGVMQPNDGFFTNILSKDSIANLTFKTPYDFSQPGSYDIAVWTALGEDQNTANDTAYLTIQNYPNITSFPYHENFNLNEGGWYLTTDHPTIHWRYSTLADSLNLLPNLVNTWLIEQDSQSIPDQRVYLNSPCLDFSNFEKDPTIAFQLFLNLESSFSEFWMEISTNQGQTWRNATPGINALNWYNNDNNAAWVANSNSSSWQYVENQLSNTAQAADVRIRFVFENGRIENQGQKIAIDNLELFYNIEANVVGLATQNSANEACGIVEDQVQLRLYNAHETTLSNIPVFYQINNGPIISEITDTLNLAGFEQQVYQFHSPFDSSLPGTYQIKAWAAFPADEANLNDTTFYQFEVAPPVALPFREDFEDEEVTNDWLTLGAADLEISPPFDHNHDSYVVAVNLWSGRPNSILQTSNYGPLSAADQLFFDYRFVLWENPELPFTPEGDSLIIEISTDCGIHFSPIHTIHTGNHTASTDFQKVQLDLSTYVGENATFRFRGVWEHGDFWLDMDNIEVSDGITTAISETEVFEQFQLSPNPTNGLVQLNLTLPQKNNISVQFFNALGRLIDQKHFTNQSQLRERIDLRNWSNGIYFVKIKVGDQYFSRKLIKVE